MKSGISSWLAMALVVWGCGRADAPAPALPADKMIAVLTDVHLAEGLMQGEMIDRKDSLAAVFYRRIWAKHGITEVDFYESYQAYVRLPKEMEVIYDSVTVRLGEIAGDAPNVVPLPRERPRPFEME